MKTATLLIFSIILLFCNSNKNSQMNYSENEILQLLDLAFKGEINEYYPKGNPNDIKYNFFLDLEHGYCETAGNKIHLYADEKNWAIVFEKSGYFNRATRAEIELDYVGNCIKYNVDKYPERNYISNSKNIVLIDNDEYDRIENKNLSDGSDFEMISKNIEQVKVKNKIIPFDNNSDNYERVGIKFNEDNNKKLIGFGDLIRYYNETDPKIISATEDEIRQNIPTNLPKIMTIENFHYSSIYNSENLPSKQELFKLIAKILVTKNIENWKPTEKPNNSWKNWESGNL